MNIRLRQVAGLGVDTLCRMVGRGQMVRAARFVHHRSRRDGPNDPRINGERALPQWIFAAAPPQRPLTVFDIGAHRGRWSGHLLELADRTGRRMALHAFEPARDTYRELAGRLPPSVQVNRLAVSDRTGEALLRVIGAGAGRNSLHPDRDPPAAVETVPVTTVDAYAAQHGVTHIDLLKIDTEGNDFPVLQGAAVLFGDQAISAAQFEYNHRWVSSRHFLKDAFDLLAPLGYRIGKLTRHGVEWYPRWHPELEIFVEGNYLACTAQVARKLPRLPWWGRPDERAEV